MATRESAIAWRDQHISRLQLATFRSEPNGEYTAEEKRADAESAIATLRAERACLLALPVDATDAQCRAAVAS